MAVHALADAAAVLADQAAPETTGQYAVMIRGGRTHTTCMPYDEALHEARQWHRRGHQEACVVLLTPVWND